MILQIIISNGILDLVTEILAKISLGAGTWAKFRLGTGIWYPTSRPSAKFPSGNVLMTSYVLCEILNSSLLLYIEYK